jgi:hypothetical protein
VAVTAESVVRPDQAVRAAMVDEAASWPAVAVTAEPVVRPDQAVRAAMVDRAAC